ncbi:hypothetical protein ACHAXA_003359 [Cyclostephanos tholiformis]|uniref:ABC1 atypical kinase-like domain-containing protein n=1 Tax=Cyclostephanos tholiformis TaxID=382380 RepID=A0ABD3RTI9_9STRA
MRALEERIIRLENDLDNAQRRYAERSNERRTHDDDDDDGREDRTTDDRKRKEKEAMMNIAMDLASANEELSSLVATNDNDDDDDIMDRKDDGGGGGIHARNARRLLDLCRSNGGVYVKVGQHLANLDLLLPVEYVTTLSSLFDDAPVSSYDDVRGVIREEFGRDPDDLFDDFSRVPIASASLAQVHTAKCRSTGRKLAIKVQHRGLRETSRGDLLAMSTVVGVAERLFEDFNFGWICEELTPQLPKELDFKNEGENAEAAAAHLDRTGLDCVVPDVFWEFTSDRVLTMQYEEGFRATDAKSIDRAGISRREVAKLISSVFNAQIFETGFVHCDPHEANILLREHPLKRGKPQIVLVDHGLYKRLDPDFQESYARLWKGIVMANIPEIKSACEQMGVVKMYPLLAAMLTSRPFDEVVERSQTKSLDASPVGNGGGDRVVIRGYAQRYLKEIVAMLDIVPRQMLLIFKMNDCLRHVDIALGSPINNLVVAGRFASKRVFENKWKKQSLSNCGLLCLFRDWLSYMNVLVRVNSYELIARLKVNSITY